MPSTLDTTLILKPIWTNGSCKFQVQYPTSDRSIRHEIDRCAKNAGYAFEGIIWTPTHRSAFSDLSNSLLRIGLKIKIEYGLEDATFNLQRLKLETSTRVKLETLEDFKLGQLYGWTPVQAEGVVNAWYWYFRARGSHWRMEIGGNESGSRSARWWYEEEWPSPTGFEAGYLGDEEAVCCILKAVEAFRTGDNSRFCPEHPNYERTVFDGWAMGALLLRTVCIRLQISGQTAVDKAQAYGIELPYTAKLELRSLNSNKTSLHHPTDDGNS